MKKIIQLKLKILAKAILEKYKPEIIGVTGSVGKTSTKDAIYAVLSSKYAVRRSLENYNNEIGLPLTIIGESSPGRSVLGWLRVLWCAVKLIIFEDKDYPKILVLEMGVDRPGDMDYLTSIVKCKVGVVTFIGPTHLEYFGTIDKIQKEKGGLVRSMENSGWAILNYDNPKSRQISSMSKSKVITYGMEDKATVRAQEVVFSFERQGEKGNLRGVSFKMSYGGSFAPVLLSGVLGCPAVYSALAAAAVGIAYEMNLLEIAEALREFKSPNGRMNIIEGIKKTLIIDDTYNSSPASVISALEVVEKIPVSSGAVKYAVLGDMLELGNQSEKGHKQVGEKAFKVGIGKLILVGERSLGIKNGAMAAGMSDEDIFHFSNSAEAGLFVQGRIKQGDLIFVKGSQGVRMEKIVKEIMAEPEKAKDLLVRQNETWLDKN